MGYVEIGLVLVAMAVSGVLCYHKGFWDGVDETTDMIQQAFDEVGMFLDKLAEGGKDDGET